MHVRPLYIETKINCDFEALWAHTQNPAIHQVWDLRFSEIQYLPKENEQAPQQFLYATKIGFGIAVKGIGESVATKTQDNGTSTSVLKFSSDSPISIIQQGSGYWKYMPEKDGIKFLTGYDYQTRWGILGKIFDKILFRPLMIWATAWSFDCLKNWLEKGIHPKQAIQSQLTVLIAHLTLAIVWIYQGLVPKLLFTDSGELEILQKSGFLAGNEALVLSFVGIGEIIFGLLFFFIYKKSIHLLNIVALIILGAGALFSDPQIFTLPFNPFSFNLSLMALSIIAIIQLKLLPKAANCITRQKK